ncbi:ABC-F family ATP-binding cassette domain-containing protein [Peribacillus sp. SCS-37]|uniref:ABC-F family ATP-binding cassette domain-containing protein n=1 Tax=Paraperibacillus esterisolvens TaxID=3115296 RepID=UPI003906BB3E
MKVFSYNSLTKHQGEKLLFSDISFSISEGDKIGIVGVNGTGKSTLLHLIAGTEEGDSGSKDHPNDYKISLLEQDPEFEGDTELLDYMYKSSSPLFELIREYEKSLEELQRNAEDARIQERVFKLQEKMDALNGWEVSANSKAILSRLGLSDTSKKLGELSGGQKKRAALARTLIESPDLLILDEPTNHLDYQSIVWLEDYLARYQGSVLFVTHDRYFLDNVSTKIWEISGGSLYEYLGNYSGFLEGKALREETEKAQSSKKENLYRKELAWIRRGAKARSTKQKARIQRFEELEGSLKSSQTAALSIDMTGTRLGKKVLEFKSVWKSFAGQPVVEDFSFLIKPGDRIGIVGRNGAGKSTLLNMIEGSVTADKGDLEIGQTVKIGYYKQENEDMDGEMRMIAYLRETAEVIHLKDGSTVSAAQMLERFLFPMNTHGTPIRKLSGGEKRRLYLLKILMSSPNVLLMDEPTNDLDTQTLTVLEDFLENFSGVVVTVSHDRYFLDKCAEQILIFQGGGQIDKYYGSYSEYLEEDAVKAARPALTAAPETAARQREKPKKKKLSYMELREWEGIEDKISSVEERIAAIQTELAGTGSDFEKANSLMKEEEDLSEELENLIDRWTELSIKMDETQ